MTPEDRAREFPIHSEDRRLYPMLPSSVPWWFVAPHEDRAQKNHQQSLARLADRGGLGWSELRVLIEDRSWPHKVNSTEDAAIVLAALAKKGREKGLREAATFVRTHTATKPGYATRDDPVKAKSPSVTREILARGIEALIEDT